MVKVYLDLKQFESVTQNMDTFQVKFLDNTAQNLQANLKMLSPVDHGRLQGSWTIFNISDTQRSVHTSTEYAEWLNDGTGIYGPNKQVITPKNGKYLVFIPKKWKIKKTGGKNYGKKVYARYVKGIQPHKFVEKSMERTEARLKELTIISINQSNL